MACPDFESLILPILQVAATGSDSALVALRTAAATKLGLSVSHLAETSSSGNRPVTIIAQAAPAGTRPRWDSSNGYVEVCKETYAVMDVDEAYPFDD